MIYGLVGKPGGGKSYEAVAYHVFPALKSGRKVVTNLPLNIEALIATFGEKVKDLVEVRDFALGTQKVKASGITISSNQKGKPFSTLECYQDAWRDDNNKGALFIIDECHLVLGRGRTPIQISDWYSMHRHQGFDILLITQNFRKVDSHICDMIELVYYVSKNTMLGSDTTYTKKVKDGLRGDTVNTEQRKYESKYFKYYQSHTGSKNSVIEASANDVKSIWSHWIVKASAVFLVLSLFMFFKAVSASNEKKEIQAASINQPVKTEIKKPVLANNTNTQLSNDNNSDLNIVDSKIKPLPTRTSTAAPAPVVKKLKHPFHKVGFHIGGRYTINDKNGFLIVASQNGQDIFNLRLKDFYMAGYDLRVLGDCMIELSYEDFYHDFVTCDAPRIGMTLANQ